MIVREGEFVVRTRPSRLRWYHYVNTVLATVLLVGYILGVGFWILLPVEGAGDFVRALKPLIVASIIAFFCVRSLLRTYTDRVVLRYSNSQLLELRHWRASLGEPLSLLAIVTSTRLTPSLIEFTFREPLAQASHGMFNSEPTEQIQVEGNSNDLDRLQNILKASGRETTTIEGPHNSTGKWFAISTLAALLFLGSIAVVGILARAR